jgi:hypothetical protein
MITKETSCTSRHLTSSGKAVDTGQEIVGIILAAGSNADATVVLDASEDGSGDDFLAVSAAQKTTESPSFAPVKCTSGAYATIGGSGAKVTILYR